MKSHNQLITILLILLFFSVFYPFREASAIPEPNQRLIPFIGMAVDYRLYIKIEDIPFTVTANWTVTWEQYNKTTPNIFISNLTVTLPFYITLITLVDQESVIIIENITSRQVLHINLTNARFLKELYDVYYSLDQPNYSPFYINTTGMSIDDQVKVYSFNMTVINTDRVSVTDFGWRNVWVIQTNTIEDNVEHFISLVYDNISGVLVGGSIYTHWFSDDRVYRVKIICQYTNALERQLIIIEPNRMLVVIVSCIPILPSLVKISRMKEIKGGL